MRAEPDWNRVFPEKVLTAEQIDAGYENANELWSVVTEKGGFVVRIPRSAFGRPRHPFWNGLYTLFGLNIHVDIEIHRKLARYIADHSHLQVPHVRVIDTSGQVISKPYTIVDRLPGKTADFTENPDAKRLAFEMGGHLGSLHRCRFDYWGVFNSTPRFTPEEWPRRVAEALDELREREGAQVEKVRAALPRFREQALALPAPSHLTLVFPDLRPSQFLEEGGELRALVDIDSIVIGPRELDLIAMEYSLTPDLVKPFVEGYSAFLPLPSLTAVRPVYRFLYYLIDVLAEDDFDEWMDHEHFFRA